LFRWFSRATLGAMPLWILRYKFTCSQAECGYRNDLDAVVQADTPRAAASQVGETQHLCGRCGRPLSDLSSLKMAAPVSISSGAKKPSVSEPGKQPSQNRGSALGNDLVKALRRARPDSHTHMRPRLLGSAHRHHDCALFLHGQSHGGGAPTAEPEPAGPANR